MRVSRANRFPLREYPKRKVWAGRRDLKIRHKEHYFSMWQTSLVGIDPKPFLENVKNLVSHDKGNTFKVIQSTLEELEYSVYYRVMDGKDYVPQHRGIENVS